MTNGRTIFKNVENSNMFTRLIVDIITVSVDTYVDNVFRQYVQRFFFRSYRVFPDSDTFRVLTQLLQFSENE